jgi:hypothetical protein
LKCKWLLAKVCFVLSNFHILFKRFKLFEELVDRNYVAFFEVGGGQELSVTTIEFILKNSVTYGGWGPANFVFNAT